MLLYYPIYDNVITYIYYCILYYVLFCRVKHYVPWFVGVMCVPNTSTPTVKIRTRKKHTTRTRHP